MKNFIILFIAICLSNVVQAQSNSEKEPFITKSLASESIQKVFARTSGGSIAVSGVNAGEVHLEVYVRNNDNKMDLSKEEIQKRLEQDYDLVITVANNQLTVTAKPKERILNWKKALSISFKIFVPQSVSTDLNTSGGSISLANLSGNQDFSTSGGSLKIDKLSGTIHGRTSGGSITVTNSKDDINLKTSGGSIKASNCNGTIKLSTSGGSLNLAELQGTIEANTSGGSIRGNSIKGELKVHTSGGSVLLQDMACSLETSTSGGSMDIEIKEFGKYLTVSNSGGNISLKIPANKGLNLKLHGNKINVIALNNFSGSKDEDDINGTLNGGGTPVSVRTNGRITLALN